MTHHIEELKKYAISKLNLNAIGITIFLLFLFIAIAAGIISPYNPWIRFEPYIPPNSSHFLGTNDMGNDILSELLFGARVSLIVGFGASIIATVLGVIIGIVSGYYRGMMDEILMAITDIYLMIPRIPLIIILAALMRPNFWLIMLLIGFLWWPTTARVVRSSTMQIRDASFILSVKSLGFSDKHIILSEILPNINHVIIPKFMLTIASAMFSEASISFLGLGDPTMKSWGMMLNFAFMKGGLINEMWWWYLPPGLCIVAVVFSLMLIGFSLEEKENIVLGLE
ncbi:MAG: dipeptide transporter [Candidatus Methanofastidiosum methylothiophilum]|jgi:peptide/nickel transport system permease protein|uniref:Dipeptide transporter n=1 Tax=Candidatus Methanofastidiosum methylothiophilum TaxID=1705564 RepID=A0A150JL78_9EURY|nr:MAG: dipeptide transporter [Candidatus Methanofastidiosum methylthiophilus]MBP6932383.1 ABC transporter permease [Methanofastidiosum sp.]OQC52257.1 MAG: dipeptide transporter [Euryarchaeota archaeon ADurb.Bin023]KYC57624.1 MAG: dipeptide transporter [Candidatus Methanofastidiosum methylthiophilus]KYC58487.1 MAG: dipeptide transporter [Candidatus Methanofastidiosum methylthiophilus]